MKETVIGTLEELVDKFGIYYVLNELQDLCYQKQAHVAEAWQDEATAGVWKAIAETLNRPCNVALNKMGLK